MQTSKKTKGEQIFEANTKLVTITVKEISQSGITLDINQNIQTKGKVNAQGVATTTVWNKTDGTSQWENKGILTTNEGDFVAVWGKGTGKNMSPTTQAWEGEVNFMAQSPKLAWLNNAKVWTEGTGDQAKGEGHAKFYQQK
jgi:hypothetical protein